MTMTMTDEMTDRDFEGIAKNDCFLREIDETGEWLRSPENIDRFVLSLKMLASDLQSQLSNYNDTLALGDREPDEEWRVRVRRLKRAVDRRLQEVVVRQRDVHRAERERGDDLSAQVSWGQVMTLRTAITEHRNALLTEEYSPTDEDMRLWSVLEDNAE